MSKGKKSNKNSAFPSKEGLPICCYALNNIDLGAILADASEKQIIFANPTAKSIFQSINKDLSFSELEGLMVTPVAAKLEDGSIKATNTISVEGRMIGYTIHRPDKALFLVHFNDITAPEVERRKYRESHHAMQILLNNTPNGVILCGIEGHILYANRVAMLLGFGGAVSGYRPVPEIKVGGEQFAIEDIAAECKRTGVCISHDRAEVLDGYGKAIRQVSVKALPLNEADGAEAMILIEDISEKTRLESQAELLLTAIEGSPTEIAILKPKGEIAYLNPAFKSNPCYSVKKLLDAGVGNTSPLDFFRAFNIWDEILEGNKWSRKLVCQSDCVRGNENHKCIKKVSVYPIYANSNSADDKTISEIVVILEDVTEKAHLEKIAEAVNAGNNLATVALGLRHEIGNPLNIIKMNLSFTIDYFSKMPPEKMIDYLTRSMSAVERIEKLLNELRNFNIHESVVCYNVSMAEFFQRFAGLVSGVCHHLGLTLTHEVSEGAEQAFIDPRAMQSVFLNFFQNSSDAFTGVDDPKISISARREGQNLVIRFADNGQGMTKEVQEKVFTPFYTTKKAGNGLGMSISNKLLAQMGCLLEVYSTPSKGTTMKIICPASGGGDAYERRPIDPSRR